MNPLKRPTDFEWDDAAPLPELETTPSANDAEGAGEVQVQTVDGHWVPLARLKHGRMRARTESINRLSKRKLFRGMHENPPVDGVSRPTKRGECLNDGPNAERPCPYVSCKYHLAVDVAPRTGAIKHNMPHIPVEEMAETCTLDVADRGGLTLEDVAQVMNLTRERIRQLESRATKKIRAFGAEAVRLLDYYVEEGVGADVQAHKRAVRKRADEWERLSSLVGVDATTIEPDDSEERAAEVTAEELSRAQSAVQAMLPVHARARTLTGAEKAARIEALKAERGGSFGKPTALHLSAHAKRLSADAVREAEMRSLAKVSWSSLILTLRLHAKTLMEQERAHRETVGDPTAMLPGVRNGMYIRECACGDMYALRNDSAKSEHWDRCLQCRATEKTRTRRGAERAERQSILGLHADQICSQCFAAPVYVPQRRDHRSREAWKTLCKECREQAYVHGLRTRVQQRRSV